MALVLTFDGMEPGSLTYYTDLDTGATVQVHPGDIVPKRKIDNPQQYIDQNVATESGDEDGGDGQIDKITDGVRSLLNDVLPVDGDRNGDTLDAMITEMQDATTADTDAKVYWAANALPPTVSNVTPAHDAHTVALHTTTLAVTMGVPCTDASWVPDNFSLVDQNGDPLDLNVIDAVADEGNASGVLTLDGEMVPGQYYRLRVVGMVSKLGRFGMEAAYVQTGPGFLVTGTPTFGQITPAEGTMDVAADTTVSIPFTIGMDSVEATLHDVTSSTSSPLTLTHAGGNVWHTPALSLIAGHHYRVSVETEGTISGTGGVHLAAAYIQPSVWIVAS